jgi:hypothetical protein
MQIRPIAEKCLLAPAMGVLNVMPESERREMGLAAAPTSLPIYQSSRCSTSGNPSTKNCWMGTESD